MRGWSIGVSVCITSIRTSLAWTLPFIKDVTFIKKTRICLSESINKIIIIPMRGQSQRYSTWIDLLEISHWQEKAEAKSHLFTKAVGWLIRINRNLCRRVFTFPFHPSFTLFLLSGFLLCRSLWHRAYKIYLFTFVIMLWDISINQMKRSKRNEYWCFKWIFALAGSTVSSFTIM